MHRSAQGSGDRRGKHLQLGLGGAGSLKMITPATSYTALTERGLANNAAQAGHRLWELQRGEAFADDPMSSPAIAEAVRWQRRTRLSPISGLTSSSLTRMLDNFERGDLREAAMMWDAVSKRDDTIPGVKSKREKSVAHKRLETVTLEKSDAAEQHKECLEDFWRNVKWVDAWNRKKVGGVKKLIRRMQDAVSLEWSAHHIVWRPTRRGLRATFEHVPLWFFENREGDLRYLPNGYGMDGEELDPSEWLISSADMGLLYAVLIGYFCKRATLQDWLRFSEKFSMPGTLGKTSAPKNSPQGVAMREAVRTFGNEWAAVIYGADESSGIELIQAEGNPAAMPMPALIERVDRKIAALYRGADLSTMSSSSDSEGTGASLQGDEADLLERDDAADRSEELQQVERRVIEWTFGSDVEPLAKTEIIVPAREDQNLLLSATKMFVGMGARLPVADTLARFGMSEADDDEAVLGGERAKGGKPNPNKGNDEAEEELEKVEAENAGDHWRFQKRDAHGRWAPEGGRAALFAEARGLLDKQGGFTLALDGESTRTGYAVAPAKETERMIPYDTITQDDFDKYIDDHWDLLTRDRAKFGGWLNLDDRNVYLDVSIVVDDIAEAAELAKAADQIAIYDLATGTEIQTDEALRRIAEGDAINAWRERRASPISVWRPSEGRVEGEFQGSGRTAFAKDRHAEGRRDERPGLPGEGRLSSANAEDVSGDPLLAAGAELLALAGMQDRAWLAEELRRILTLPDLLETRQALLRLRDRLPDGIERTAALEDAWTRLFAAAMAAGFADSEPQMLAEKR